MNCTDICCRNESNGVDVTREYIDKRFDVDLEALGGTEIRITSAFVEYNLSNAFFDELVIRHP